MPKKLFAVTNVKVGPGEEDFFAAGSELDPTKFNREQLVSLHDAGAVEVRVVEDAAKSEPEPEPESTGATPEGDSTSEE